jgi:hypothetical protein
MRLFAAVLSLVLAFDALGGGSRSAVLAVVVTVRPSATFRLESRRLEVAVSEEDIARGYVDLPASSVLSVDVGRLHPVIVAQLEAAESRFRSIEMETEPTMVAAMSVLEALPATGAARLSSQEIDFAVAQMQKVGKPAPAPTSGGSASVLSYRIKLFDWVRPGRYTVPMTVDVRL